MKYQHLLVSLAILLNLNLAGCESGGSLDGPEPDPAVVTAGDVDAGDVTAGDVTAGNVTAGNVQAGLVTAGNVTADGGVLAGDVAAGSVQAGLVTAGDVAAGNVTAGDVAAGDVLAGDVLAGDVTVAGNLEVTMPGLAPDVAGLELVWIGYSADPAAAWTAASTTACAGGIPRAVQGFRSLNTDNVAVLVAIDCP